MGGSPRDRAHSPTFPSFHPRHNSFSNSSVALPTSQFILQLFRCFTYVTDHSPTLFSLLLLHRLFTYVTWRAAHDVKNEWDTRGPVSDIYEQSSFLQPFCHFTYVIAHSPTLLSLYLRHSSFSNPSVASPTSQFILQPFFRSAELIHQPFRNFTYVTAHSPTLSSLYLRHSSFSNPSVASLTSQFILQLVKIA